jgi:hypothetical protein
MTVNHFKPLANSGGALVLSQAAYEALTSILANGFGPGALPKEQINKALRQSSTMSYVLAEFIRTRAGVDVLDNGDPATILTNLLTALLATISVVPRGTASNLQILTVGLNNTSSVVTASEIVLQDNAFQCFLARNVSLTINSTVSGLNGLDTGSLVADTWYSVWVISDGGASFHLVG